MIYKKILIVTLKRLAHLVAERRCDQVNVDCLLLEEEGVHQLVNLKVEIFIGPRSDHSLPMSVTD